MKKIVIIFTVVAVFVVPSFASAHISPLSMRQAKIAAISRGFNFHPKGGVEKVKSSWCNQWNSYKIDCGVSAEGSYWDSEFDSYSMSFCSATVDVTKNRFSGIISTRVEHNMSCFN